MCPEKRETTPDKFWGKKKKLKCYTRKFIWSTTERRKKHIYESIIN